MYEAASKQQEGGRDSGQLILFKTVKKRRWIEPVRMKPSLNHWPTSQPRMGCSVEPKGKKPGLKEESRAAAAERAPCCF